MKFPLKERPFDAVRLPMERLARLERRAQDVVDATLREFHHFVHVQNRVVSSAQFKAVKKHDQVTVYKQLTARADRAFGPLARPRRDAPPLLPKLLVVGTVRGAMDDMLLGTAVRDPASVVVKTSYVDDEIVDCSVVHEMRGATPSDPFRFVALKWFVKSHPNGLNAVVAPRDLVVVQSSGLLASEGIGFHLLHSVDPDDVPECGSLEGRFGIVRSRISVMFIFRQLAPEVIEIYAANYVEPNGSAPEAVAIMSSASSMSTSWKALSCAHNMKLAWILQHKAQYLGLTGAPLLNTGDACELCHKKATLTGRLGDCRLCDARVCSRCRVTKKLTRANRRLELHTEKLEFCKTCLVRAVNEDACRIAAEMNVGVPMTPWKKVTDAKSRTFSFASVASSHGSHSSHNSQGSHSSRGGGGWPHYHSSDTISTASSSGMFSERERDYETFASHRKRSTSSGRSWMATARTHTSSLDEFHDGDTGTADSVIVEPLGRDEQRELQQYQAYLAQQLEQKKRELQRQFEPQMQQRHEASSQPTQQLAAHVRRPPPPPPPTATPPIQAHEEGGGLKGADRSQDHFETLYAQMKSLQMAAEKAYELTQDNTRKLNHDQLL